MQVKIPYFNYTVINQAEAGTLVINIDGNIADSPTQELLREFWGDTTSVSFKSLRSQVEAVPNLKEVTMYINSTGGHVGDAMAAHDFFVELENKGVKVNRVGRGIIASAATYLLCGKNSTMTANSLFMIHNIQMLAYGDIVQCENQVAAGRKFNDLVRDFYVNHTGKPKETIAAWMNKEKWFSAEEAEQNGFIEKATDEVAIFENIIKEDDWLFQNKGILNTYNSFTNKTNDDMSNKITEAIENAFAKFFGDPKNKDVKVPENFAKNLATEVGNAITPLVLTEETATTLFNKLLEEATKDDVTELQNHFVAKPAFENFKADVLKAVGNKTPGKEKEEGEKPANAGKKNRFSNIKWFPETAAKN